MADLTPVLTDLLSKHNSGTLQFPHEPKDEFLKEAYRIVRPPPGPPSLPKPNN